MPCNTEVPSALRSLDQWIRWGYDERGRKIPYQVNGRKAKSNDPSTWSSFAVAHAAGEQLGFCFAENGGLFGLDLDGCRDPATGQIAEWCKRSSMSWPAIRKSARAAPASRCTAPGLGPWLDRQEGGCGRASGLRQGRWHRSLRPRAIFRVHGPAIGRLAGGAERLPMRKRPGGSNCSGRSGLQAMLG